MLRLAFEYGWEPMGTLPGEIYRQEYETEEEFLADWDGIYSSNNFQRVTEKDAKNIAAALRRAYSEIPDEDSEPWIREGVDIEDEEYFLLKKEFEQDNDREFYDMFVCPLRVMKKDIKKKFQNITYYKDHRIPAEYLENVPMNIQWSGSGKYIVAEFIEFCEEGSFTIG